MPSPKSPSDLEALLASVANIVALIGTLRYVQSSQQRSHHPSHIQPHHENSPALNNSNTYASSPSPGASESGPSTQKSLGQPATSISCCNNSTKKLASTGPEENATPEVSPSHSPTKESAIDPLALLSDASKLLSAHVTKLSLLTLNEPFSPKEISFILSELSRSCLPALASSLELFRPEVRTRCLHRYVEKGLGKLWTQLLPLVDQVRQKAEAVKSKGKSAPDTGSQQGTLTSTGIIWDQCANLSQLSAPEGVRKALGDEMQSKMSLIADAIQELEEWDPEDPGDSDSEDEAFSDQETDAHSGGSTAKSPSTSEDEEALVKKSSDSDPLIAGKIRVIKHLKLLRMLCEALKKRRVMTFPAFSQKTSPAVGGPSAEQVEILDKIVDCAQFLTEEADELAGALYDDDIPEVESRLKVCRTKASDCVDLVRLDWQGESDVFTTWSQGFVARIQEVGARTD